MADTAAADAPTPAPSLFKKRGPKASTIRKRAATPPPDSGSDSDYYSSEDESGRKIKRRKTHGIAAGSSATVKRPHETATDLKATEYAADTSTAIRQNDDATKASNWYDESSLLGNTAKRTAATTTKSPDPTDTSTYKGLASSNQTFIQRNPNAPSRAVGPVKAPTNVRTVTVTDFAPDVCKDYKQTGFCGFGDSCKFLHAREDYKQGWELDREWDINTRTGARRQGGTTVASRGGAAAEGDEDAADEALLESIPFACVICKEPYKNPVVTKCGHYFCEACALRRYKKNPNCAICGAGTGGVFNGAKQLKRLLERKRERAAKRRKEAEERGEEISDEEEEAGGGDSG